MHRLIRDKNRVLNQWEQYYRKDNLESFPITIQLPTGTRCNIRCKFCTDRSGEKAVSDYRDLSFAECRSIIENGSWGKALRRIESIDLYGWGEPLFNPDYERIFDYITGNFPGLGINISTNGILFTQKWSQKIVAVDNSTVNFSVNAATKETFRKLQGSSRFESVIDNVRGLTDLRERHQTKNPHVCLSYVATMENIKELPQFVDLSADLRVDCIKVQDVIIMNRETERLSLTNEPHLAHKVSGLARKRARARKIKIWFFVTHQVDYFQSSIEQAESCDLSAQTAAVGDQAIPSPYFAKTDCFEPWEMFQVCANGEVWPCCQFQNLPGSTLGNVYEQSLEDIWNGDAYRFFRRKINTDKPPLVCSICPKKAGIEY